MKITVIYIPASRWHLNRFYTKMNYNHIQIYVRFEVVYKNRIKYGSKCARVCTNIDLLLKGRLNN